MTLERQVVEDMAQRLGDDHRGILIALDGTRKRLTEIARTGEITIAELSRLSGVSRQTLTAWRDGGEFR